MNPLSKKNISRIKIIIAGGLARFITSFTNLFISLVIIRFVSPELWGEIVYYLLFLDLCFIVISWGNGPYLSTVFSLHPQKIKEGWFTSSSARSILLILFIVVISFSSFPSSLKWTMIAWSVGRYIYQSFESI